MLTEEEFFTSASDKRIISIYDRYVDTQSVYDSYNSSLDVCYKNGNKRCTIKVKKKLEEIQYHIIIKTKVEGKAKRIELGVIGKDNMVTDRVTASIFATHFTDIWKDKNKGVTNFSLSNPDWSISIGDTPFQYRLFYKNKVVANIIKVMTEPNGTYHDYKHLLQMYDYNYELQCLFLFIAVSILDNTNIFDEPSKNNTIFNAIFK